MNLIIELKLFFLYIKKYVILTKYYYIPFIIKYLLKLTGKIQGLFYWKGSHLLTWKPLELYLDLDTGGFFANIYFWVLITWVTYIMWLWLDDFDEEDFYSDFVGNKDFEGGFSTVSYAEDWIIWNYEDVRDDNETNDDETEYEDLDHFINNEEDEGLEPADEFIDRPFLEDFFEPVYNHTDPLENFLWPPPRHPLWHVDDRDYFLDFNLAEKLCGIDEHIELFTDDLDYPDELESYIVKYENYYDTYEPDYWTIPPVSYFYRDFPTEEMVETYFVQDPFVEEPEGVQGPHDIDDLFDYMWEETIDEDSLDEEEDELIWDFFFDYQDRSDEDDRIESVYGATMITGIIETDAGFDLEDIDYPDEELFNMFDECANEVYADNAGDYTFYPVFPNVTADPCIEPDEDNEMDFPDLIVSDLNDLFLGSLFYKRFTDIDPAQFWDYSVMGLLDDQPFFYLLDNFGSSSAELRSDEVFSVSFDFYHIAAEARVLKFMLMGELEQRVFDVKQLYNAVTSLHLGQKYPFYPVRFSSHKKYYEAFNYSSMVWVSLGEILSYSRAEFLFLERELSYFYGGLLPVAMSRRHIFFKAFYNFSFHILVGKLWWHWMQFMNKISLANFPYVKNFDSVAGPLFGETDLGFLGAYELDEFIDKPRENKNLHDASIMLDFFEYCDRNAAIPYWIRLGLPSYARIVENHLFDYDPRKANFFYGEVLSAFEKGLIKPMPYIWDIPPSMTLYLDAIEELSFVKRREELKNLRYQFDDYAWNFDLDYPAFTFKLYDWAYFNPYIAKLHRFTYIKDKKL